MAAIKKACRVCGKQYSVCSSSIGDGVHRWRNVACCASCYAEYIRRIEVSRQPQSEVEIKTDNVPAVVEEAAGASCDNTENNCLFVEDADEDCESTICEDAEEDDDSDYFGV